jgi:hypothetical protein
MNYFWLGTCFLSSVALTMARVKNMKSNILFILDDDLGYGDICVYNPDSKIPTPNIHQMEQTGVMFTLSLKIITTCWLCLQER